VVSIGQGIIGSAAEENTRKRVNWEEGASYLLPCSKGIACGWIHKKLDTDDSKREKNNTAEGVGRPTSDVRDVMIYALKVSPDTLLSMKGNISEDTQCWVKKAYELFGQCLAKTGTDGTSDDGSGAIEGILLSDEESLMMSLILELVQDL